MLHFGAMGNNDWISLIQLVDQHHAGVYSSVTISLWTLLADILNHHVHAAWNSRPIFTPSSRECAVYLYHAMLVGMFTRFLLFFFLFGIIMWQLIG